MSVRVEHFLRRQSGILLLAVLLRVRPACGDDLVSGISPPPVMVQRESVVGGTNVVSPSPQTTGSEVQPAVPAERDVVVLSPPSPAEPSEAENQKQRRLLLGLMAALISIAAWRQFRRRI